MESEPEADADLSPIPIFQPVAQCANRTLEKNIIELALGPSQGYWYEPTAISMVVDPKYAADLPYAFRNSHVRGNLIRQIDWKTDGYHTGITVRGAENLVADKNIIDVGEPQPLRFTKTVAPAFFNNRTPAGKLIRGFNEERGSKVNDIQDMIDDVFLLSL